ncbi:peptidoglycan D,D-transpeptidase FtsI family protein [Egicoccus sp. AB-alg2]|uniref:peptidoglycan D,D-transpeptidase FtsI family protein n=1 Tax=Egicoccus sp. AB-alg2 TaxID=3242693 RepID=UPI00359D1ECF
MTQQPRRFRALGAPRVQRTARDVGTRRIRWLLLIYGLVFLLTFGQLVNIQVVQGSDYADRSVRQRARIVDLAATRGRIYDREGDVLATSVQSATVYADPRAYRPTETPDGQPVPAAGDSQAAAEELAPLLDLSVADVRDRLERDAHFVYLGRQLDWELGQRIRDLDLPGIGVLSEPKRVYPAGPLAGQIVGFTGIDGEGLQGLEAQYDRVLRGRPGMLAFEQAPGGLGITSGTRELSPSEPGTDLVLTLDRDIQYAAQQSAADVVEEFGAKGASVVVMDAKSFEVLAMASTPTFDPNDRGNTEPDTWRNRAVTDVFEPGSTQKALTIAAAVEEGIVDPDAVTPSSRGVRVGGKTFTDTHPYPGETWTVGDIMERSSNVGTIELAQELGPERLYDYLRAFGYGQSTGVGFPGESDGLLMSTENWWGTSLPTISIGQGVAVTLMQLATSYATLANDGVARTPKIVRGTVGEDGRLTPTASGGEQRVVSADTAAQVRAMLERVVSGEHGTGNRAAVPGYTAAGKTGTARKPSADSRGYSGEYIATFVGFAPVESPEIVVAVMVDEPRPFYGGLVAAPVFSEVMGAALSARRVVPDGGSRSLDDAIDEARLAAAEAAAATEDPPLPPDDPGSPPVGDPVGD